MQKSSHVWHGVALGWRRDVGHCVSQLESTSERIAGARLSLHNESLLLLSYYAPTSGQDDYFLESICDLSEFLLQHLNPGDKVIIGADYNCSKKSSTRRQDAWKSFCERFQLSTIHSPHPSFHHHNGLSESFLDIFATSSSLSMDSIMQHCTLENPMNLSSHDPIMTTTSICTDISTKSCSHTHTYSDFRRQKIVWDQQKLPEYQKLASQALSGAVKYWDKPESLPHLSSLVSKLLVTCATLVFDSKTSNPMKSPRKPSLKTRQAQNMLKKTFFEWKKCGKPSSKENPARAAYSQARSNLQNLRRYEDKLSTIITT